MSACVLLSPLCSVHAPAGGDAVPVPQHSSPNQEEREKCGFAEPAGLQRRTENYVHKRPAECCSDTLS